jgi:cation diffusion facilitator family transporter
MRALSHIPAVEARAAVLALGIGSALMAVKFAAFFLTGSAVIFADAMESIVNVLAAAFAVYALYYAHQPADESHPYGHGKIEFLAAGFEGGMILLAALVGAAKAVDSLVRGVTVADARVDFALLLIAVALVVNGLLGWHLVRTGRRQGSITLVADGKHLLTDAVTSVAALAGLGTVRLTDWGWADPLAAILVSAYIATTGLGLVRHAIAGLMDQQDVEDDALLQRILDSHVGLEGVEPRICGYHKLRHRHSGRYHWVDFHVQVPAGWDVARGHEAATAIEREIQHALGEGNATAHVEPCGAVECGWCGEERNAGIAAPIATSEANGTD